MHGYLELRRRKEAVGIAGLAVKVITHARGANQVGVARGSGAEAISNTKVGKTSYLATNSEGGRVDTSGHIGPGTSRVVEQVGSTRWIRILETDRYRCRISSRG